MFGAHDGKTKNTEKHTSCAQKDTERMKAQNLCCLSCRPWCGDVNPTAVSAGAAAGGDCDIQLSRREADPVVSASASAVASKHRVDGRRETKRKMNNAKVAPAAKKKKKSRATSERNLPTGVQERSGRFIAQTRWGGKRRYTCILVRLILSSKPLSHRKSYMSVKKDLEDPNLLSLSVEVNNAIFDAAKTKALGPFGGVVPEK